MAFATELEDLRHLREQRVERAVLENREHRRQLLTRKPVRLSDRVLLDDDEGLSVRQLESSFRRNGTRRPRNGVHGAASLRVPHHRLELALLLRARKIAA